MTNRQTHSELKEAPLPGLFDCDVIPPDFSNHRERLRDRLMQSGVRSVADYELLELVLFRAVPKRDVKVLARELLARFGDFNHVIAAPMEQLLDVIGLGPAAARELKIVEAAAHRMAQAQIMDREVISSWDKLIDYCTTTMAHLHREQFRVLFLNRKNMLIADEVLQTGTIDHVPVYPREIARRALTLNASAVILIHNHPSGDPTPSEADIAMTHRVHDALLALDLTLHDHVVIGKGKHVSFRSENIL